MRIDTLKIQSISDVITNSSSEIFIINDPKDISMKIEAYEGFLYGIQEYCNLFIEAEHQKGYYEDIESYEDCFHSSIAESKYYDKFYEYSYYPGDLLIESNGDNSIPWEVMDYIENSASKHGYSCKRRHLG